MAVNKPYHPVNVNPRFYDHPEGMKTNRGDHIRDLSFNRAIFDHVLETRNPHALTSLDALWGLKPGPEPILELDDKERYPWLNRPTAVKTAADIRAAITAATANLPHYEQTPFVETIIDELIGPFSRPLQEITYAYTIARENDRTDAVIALVDALDEGRRNIRRGKRALTELFNRHDQRDWTEDLVAADIADALKHTVDNVPIALASAAVTVTRHTAQEAAEVIFNPPLRSLAYRTEATATALDLYFRENDTTEDNIVKTVRDLSVKGVLESMALAVASIEEEKRKLATTLTEDTNQASRAKTTEQAILAAFRLYQEHNINNRELNSKHQERAFNAATAGYTPKQRKEAARILAEAVNWQAHRAVDNWRTLKLVTNRDTSLPRQQDSIIKEYRERQYEILCTEQSAKVEQATKELANALEMSETTTIDKRQPLKSLPPLWQDLPVTPDSQDHGLANEYETLTSRITERLTIVLLEHAAKLRGHPSVRELLRDPAYHQAMTRFLKPYDEQTRRNLLAQLNNYA